MDRAPVPYGRGILCTRFEIARRSAPVRIAIPGTVVQPHHPLAREDHVQDQERMPAELQHRNVLGQDVVHQGRMRLRRLEPDSHGAAGIRGWLSEPSACGTGGGRGSYRCCAAAAADTPLPGAFLSLSAARRLKVVPEVDDLCSRAAGAGMRGAYCLTMPTAAPATARSPACGAAPRSSRTS